MLRSSIPLRPLGVAGYGGLAVTPHVLSTQAAMATMAGGGNGVDAAVAANAVQGVVAPETCGLGGDLFALISQPGVETPLALNSSGRAGSRAADLADELRRSGVEAIPQRHPAAITVPGCVDGWLELHQRLGRIDLATVLGPAIQLARNGFPANREMTAAFAARQEELGDEPSAADLYPSGRPPLEGDRIVRPALAVTLEAIVDDGREAFYAGTIGPAISDAVEGALTPSDLERSQADWVEPLSVDVFGATGWTIPPNSQGYIALVALAIADRLGLPPPDDPAAWHLGIESYRLAAADRDDVLSDPESMEMPAGALVASERLEELAALYSPEVAAHTTPARDARGGTAYMCVVDGDGLGVSLIQSNFHGIGSGVSVVGGGFLLHDRGRGFTLQSGHPNELAPGQRPLHTLSPTIWTRDGRLSGIIGTRGGYMQPQLVAQLATLIAGHGFEPQRAMAAPRWMVPLPNDSEGRSLVEVEPGTPEPVVDGLVRRGHTVQRHQLPQGGWGPMSAIRISTEGLRTGAADPRVDTATAATI